ncbi:hypothetical protein AVW11_04130 [Streptomyces amritsarensis]|uniref:Tyr recombinase domain-containing protein n=1 Tax=Streptomyces amritsarensis TaxID=681158 RepID=A0ABX3GBW0_9ACTN|nr:site-specific integrase [Streptomyces amritsarensis]OLZ72588.1 hypothetical protein AVW11_04130 [Streptomyces amritsarensis]
MPRTVQRPILAQPDARALLAATRVDPLLHAAVSVMLMAGLRPTEAARLTVADYAPGDEPRLRVVGGRHIQIARSAAVAMDAYLASQEAEPGEPLLLGLQENLPQLVRRAAEQVGVQAGVHSLRRAAIAAALEDNPPHSHIEAYFGINKALDRKALTPLPEGYDAGMAATLEAAFGF